MGVQAVTRRGQRRVTPNCAGGCKLFVPLGANATKSCVKVRLRRKEPTRHQSRGADKGANPRTGSAWWSGLVGRPNGDGDTSELRRRTSLPRGVGGRCSPLRVYVRLDCSFAFSWLA